LAVAGIDGSVTLWEPGAQKVRAGIRPGTRIFGLAFSPGGRTLATAAAGGVLSLWDVATGRGRGRLTGHKAAVRAVAFSPTGDLLASAGADATVRLWDLRTRRPHAVLRGQPRQAATLAFSPDGRTLVAGGRDGGLTLWDGRKRPDGQPPRVDLALTGPAAFSRDGKLLALPNRDRTVRLLDAATLRGKAVLRGHRHRVTHAAFAPDGRALATAGAGGAVRWWDLDRGRTLWRSLGHAGPVSSLAVAPAGGLLASGGRDGTVRLWDQDTGKPRGTLGGHSGVVVSLAFLPDGQTLLAAGRDGEIVLWQVPVGTKRQHHRTGQALLQVVLSLDGRRFATVPLQGAVKLWKTAGLKPLDDIPSGPDALPAGAVLCAAFSPDGKTLALGRQDGVVVLWRTRPTAFQARFPGHGEGVSALAFAPQGTTLATASPVGAVRLWDLGSALTATRMRKPFGQPPDPVRALAFSADSTSLAAATGRRPPASVRTAHRVLGLKGIVESSVVGRVTDTVRFWDVATGRERRLLRPQPAVPDHWLVAFSPCGRWVATASVSGSVWLWDRATGRRKFVRHLGKKAAGNAQLEKAIVKHRLPIALVLHGEVRALAFSPDGKTLAAAGAGVVKLWDTATGKRRARWPGPRSGPAGVAFSHDGRTLAVNHGGQIRLWDVARRRLRQTLGRPGGSAVRCLAFSPDDTWLAAGLRDGRLVLWDWQGGGRKFLTGHAERVTALAFTQDGQTLASGSWDGTVKLWNPATPRELVSLESHGGKVEALAFSPDGRTLASGGATPDGKGEIFLWGKGFK
jgi:WD40 repeat protein